MAKYTVIWGTHDVGATGVFDETTGEQVISAWELWEIGLSTYKITGWDDEAIEGLVKRLADA